jgi:hypothetical protein
MAQLASRTNAVPVRSGPWSMEAAIDAAWEPAYNTIDPVRWNKLYPYQFIVVQYANGRYEPVQLPDGQWSFTLPIPPESLTISTPFAIDTRATLEGIVEEHGGAPFRLINIAGTTGVVPLRSSATKGRPDALNPELLALAGGTVLSTLAVAETATRLVPRANLMTPTEFGRDEIGSISRGSGYYQMRLLQQFFERYARVKMTATGRNMRLALAMWKDQSVYLITPQSFEVQRSAASPLRYNYRISAKAWRRIELSGPGPIHPLEIDTGGLGNLTKTLEVLAAARDTVIRSKDLLAGIRGDAANNALFSIFRETVLLVKDLAGLSVSVADLPANVIKAGAGSITKSWDGLGPNLIEARQQTTAALKRSQDALTFKDSSSQGKQIQEGQSTAEQAMTKGGSKTLESVPGDSRSPLAIQKLFDNPLSAHAAFSAVDVRRVNFAPNIASQIRDEVNRVRGLRRSDLLERQMAVREIMQDFADAVGQGSATFDATTDRVPKPQTREATDADFEILWALNNTVMAFDKLILRQEDQSNTNIALSYVAGLARGNGVAFQQPVSKFAVPFPYGGTLESLARQYLGDANRWHEIAVLNGLRAPYVDETGFELSLLVNGNGNTLAISDASNLYVGQMIQIGSRTITQTTRRITSIEKISDGFYYINVDGNNDMSLYTTTAGAYLHTYLPDTVNSTQQIFIPSPQAVDPSLVNRDVPGVPSFQTLLDAGGIDLALTSANDIIVTADGDTPWAVGLNNILQRLRILVSTPRGSLLQHPSVGIEVPVGISTADLDAEQLLEATRGLLSQDSDFARVEFAAVQKVGPVARQIIHVGVNGVEQLIPVSFDVVR